MYICVSTFRTQCLELIRQIEAGGEPITIRRHDNALDRLLPPTGSAGQNARPWEQPHGSGALLASAEEFIMQEGKF
jgi:antitoxin (DNA-binding transcriptional repressor) of toxin-antitoxin stability system